MKINNKIYNRIVFLFCASTAIVFVTTAGVAAKIINLPEDYPSIQEAVEAASSGDEIKVNQHDVVLFLKDLSKTPGLERKGIRVIDKDLTVIGTTPFERTRITKQSLSSLTFLEYTGQEIPPESNANLLVIENSNVVFQNLEMNDFPEIVYPPFGFPFGTTAAPIQVVSGKLTMENVEFTGLIKVFGDLKITDSTIFGYSFYQEVVYRIRQTNPIPALHIRDQNNPNITISNTDILSGTLEGGRPIVLEDLSNGSIQITNATITTGGHLIINNDVSDSYWRYSNPERGLAGILIVNCNSLELDLSQTSTTGGGGAAIPNRGERIPSGPGIEVLNSSEITIRNGRSKGQVGIIGGKIDLDGFLLIQSSDGGNGIDIFNSSVVLANVDLVPGNGGSGNPEMGVFPGRDGVPFFRDANSTVSFETGMLEWPIF